MLARITVIAAGLLALAPGSSSAGVVSAVQGPITCYRTVCDATLAVTYAPAEGERLDAAFTTEAAETTLTVFDPGGVQAAEGCSSTGATTARCVLTEPGVNAPFVSLVARGGDGDDRLVADRSLFRPKLSGGAGNDVLTGRGDLDGGPGDDDLDGLGATDAMLDGGSGADRLSGGAVSYSDRREAVRFDASRPGSSAGEAGEGDIVGPGVFAIFGGSADDVLTARDQGTALYGAGGDDVLVGGFGTDRLFGGSGSDRLDGGRGSDRLDGGPGTDELTGGGTSRGRDVLDGGSGNDAFDLRGGSRVLARGGAGADDVRGPGAGDVVSLRGGGRDRVRCGRGLAAGPPATLLLDRRDVTTGRCRGVRRSSTR